MMRQFIGLSLSLSLSVAAAMATETPFDSQQYYNWTPTTSGQSTCDASSFSHAGGAPAADWRHCAALFSSWANRSGVFWIHDESGAKPIPIVASKHCRLGVRAEVLRGGLYGVGDKDVRAILGTALHDFSEGTRLEVQGEVNCTTSMGGKASLYWQIYDEKR